MSGWVEVRNNPGNGAVLSGGEDFAPATHRHPRDGLLTTQQCPDLHQ